MTTTHPDAPQGAAPEVEARITEILAELEHYELNAVVRAERVVGKPKLESEIVKSICRYLNGYGRNCKYWKNLGGAQMRDGKIIGRSLAGRCDLEILVFGKMYFLEVKKPVTGRVSPAQTKEHKEIEEAGGQVHIVYSVADVKAIIEPDLPVRELFEGE